MKIENLLNNPEFQVKLSKLLTTSISETILTKNYIKILLELQIKTLETLKGKTGQELNESVDKISKKLNSLALEESTENYMNLLNDLMSD
ncbi:hypothetical protein [Polaribacter sp. M15]